MNDFVELYGYKIYKNGNIIGKKTNKLITKRKQIKIYLENGKKQNVSYARLIYFAFHQNDFDFNDKNIVITKNNEDKNDYSLDNLKAMETKDILHGEKNKTAKLTDEQVEEIRYIYNKYKNERGDNNNPNVRISYRKLAELYNVSHTAIQQIVNGKYRNEERYKIKC